MARLSLKMDRFELLANARASADRGIGVLGRLPLISRLNRAAFELRPGTCWGVFESFEEATSAAPRSKPLGYDNERAAALYRQFLAHVEPRDYAVAFWLQRRLRPGSEIFDFGGHVGIKYYALQTVMPLPEGVEWVVYDVPAVVAAGRKLAAERGETRLRFTDSFADADGATVFMALGSLQFIETPLAALLRPLSALPPYVIVSSAPMTDRPRYVTLHNNGAAYCPYLVEERESVIAGMASLGYELVHAWKNPEKLCKILGSPDRSVHGYTSMHFARESPATVPRP